MTTIIAVQCRDGAILCADGQETSPYTKENVKKIHSVGFGEELDKNCILACAGASNYIALFRQYVGKAFLSRNEMTYFDTLEKATWDYTNYITERSQAMGGLTFEGSEYPSGIFVGYDRISDKTLVYELNPPHPPHELASPWRNAIGSGQLYTSLFFQMAEKFLYKMELDWPDLGTTLVS